MDQDWQGHGEIFSIQESVELERCRREGKVQPSYADIQTIRAWLAEQRLRWAKEGHPGYQHLLPKA